jgi:dolichol kinase
MYLENNRKIFHIILGVVLSILIFYIRKVYLVSVFTFFICAGAIIRLFLLKGKKIPIIERFLSVFGRYMEFGLGAMNFFIGVLLSLIFPFPREFSAISVLILGVSDGLATIVGINSKYKIYKNKTLNGTLAFFTTSYIILIIGMNSIISSLGVAIVLTLLELFSPIDDNLLIPIGGTMLISLVKLI